ncbi:MAG: hypothetical protein JWM95_2101 [Gemmatimonadetes bacterium]|nr:hypothetical protein [Gemmatimonadota bacterium]
MSGSGISMRSLLRLERYGELLSIHLTAGIAACALSRDGDGQGGWYVPRRRNRQLVASRTAEYVAGTTNWVAGPAPLLGSSDGESEPGEGRSARPSGHRDRDGLELGTRIQQALRVTTAGEYQNK